MSSCPWHDDVSNAFRLSRCLRRAAITASWGENAPVSNAFRLSRCLRQDALDASSKFDPSVSNAFRLSRCLRLPVLVNPTPELVTSSLKRLSAESLFATPCGGVRIRSGQLGGLKRLSAESLFATPHHPGGGMGGHPRTGLKRLSAESLFATVDIADNDKYYTKLPRLKGGGIS